MLRPSVALARRLSDDWLGLGENMKRFCLVIWRCADVLHECLNNNADSSRRHRGCGAARRSSRFVAIAACLLSTITLTRAQQPREATPDDVCAMITAYAKMGADHARFVALVPYCEKSARCMTTRDAMISALRPDSDMLNCDQAPPPDPSEACLVLRSERETLDYLSRGAFPSFSPLARQLIEHDAAKLSLICNKKP